MVLKSVFGIRTGDLCSSSWPKQGQAPQGAGGQLVLRSPVPAWEALAAHTKLRDAPRFSAFGDIPSNIAAIILLFRCP